MVVEEPHRQAKSVTTLLLISRVQFVFQLIVDQFQTLLVGNGSAMKTTSVTKCLIQVKMV
jgi:hypothetical protein